MGICWSIWIYPKLIFYFCVIYFCYFYECFITIVEQNSVLC